MIEGDSRVLYLSLFLTQLEDQARLDQEKTGQINDGRLCEGTKEVHGYK